jgi:AraC family transcriptional regulator
VGRKQLTSDDVLELGRQSLLAGYTRPALSSAGAPWEGVEVEVFDFSQPTCLRPVSFSKLFISTLRAGRARLWTEHERNLREIAPGNTGIHPAGMPFGGSNPEPSAWITVYLKQSLVKQVGEEFLDPARIEIVHTVVPQDAQFEWLSLALEHEIKGQYRSGRLFGESLATALAAHVLSRYTTKRLTIPEYRGGMSRYLLQRTIDYIRNHLGTDLRLSELAENVGMSHWHFCRSFRQSTGMSPHQYVLRQRIEEAKRKLVRRDADLSEIAAELGFNNHSHFTSTFKKIAGCTPRQFRSRS